MSSKTMPAKAKLSGKAQGLTHGADGKPGKLEAHGGLTHKPGSTKEKGWWDKHGETVKAAGSLAALGALYAATVVADNRLVRSARSTPTPTSSSAADIARARAAGRVEQARMAGRQPSQADATLARSFSQQQAAARQAMPASKGPEIKTSHPDRPLHQPRAGVPSKSASRFNQLEID